MLYAGNKDHLSDGAAKKREVNEKTKTILTATTAIMILNARMCTPKVFLFPSHDTHRVNTNTNTWQSLIDLFICY